MISVSKEARKPHVKKRLCIAQLFFFSENIQFRMESLFVQMGAALIMNTATDANRAKWLPFWNNIRMTEFISKFLLWTTIN